MPDPDVGCAVVTVWFPELYWITTVRKRERGCVCDIMACLANELEIVSVCLVLHIISQACMLVCIRTMRSENRTVCSLFSSQLNV